MAGHCDLYPVEEAHLVKDNGLKLTHPDRSRSAHGHVDVGRALPFLCLFLQIEGGDEILLIRPGAGVPKTRHPRRCGAEAVEAEVWNYGGDVQAWPAALPQLMSGVLDDVYEVVTPLLRDRS